MTFKLSQNGDPRTLKGDKNQQYPMTIPATKKIDSEQCSLNFNPGNPWNPANPFTLQISSQLVARGAGGRGEALRSAPTPQGVKGVPIPQMQFLNFLRFFCLRGVRPFRRPLQKVTPKLIKNRIKKKSRILTENGLPKGPSKSQKSDQICKMGLSNALRDLLCSLSFEKRVPSRLQGPPEPQKLWFYYSKTIIFRNPL